LPNVLRNRPTLLTPRFLAISGATLAFFLADGVLLPVVPRFVEGPLGGSDLAVGLSIGAFGISALLLRPWAGRLGDRRGRRVLLLIGASFLAATTLGYVLVSSIPGIFALRLLGGAGEAFFFTGAAAAIVDMAPEERRGEAVSFLSLSLYLGIGIGPLIGESLLDRFGYDAVWWTGVGFAVLAGLLTIRLPETLDAQDAMEPRPFRLLHPSAFLPGLVMLTLVSGMSSFFTFVPLYTDSLGMAGARYVLFTLAAVVILVRSVGARLPDLLGAKRASRIAVIGGAAGLLVMGLWREPAGLYAGTIIFALGNSLAFPSLASLALDGVPANERGSVLGTFTAFVDLGFGLGPALLGIVAHAAGYPTTFVVASMMAACGLLVLAAPGLRARRGMRTDEVLG
jgi:MFS family permease